MDSEEIAYQLDEELNGNIEHCHYGERPCILRSDPTVHPNRRYNENNVQIVYLDGGPLSKQDVKNELLSHWGVQEV